MDHSENFVYHLIKRLQENGDKTCLVSAWCCEHKEAFSLDSTTSGLLYIIFSSNRLYLVSRLLEENSTRC